MFKKILLQFARIVGITASFEYIWASFNVADEVKTTIKIHKCGPGLSVMQKGWAILQTLLSQHCCGPWSSKPLCVWSTPSFHLVGGITHPAPGSTALPGSTSLICHSEAEQSDLPSSYSHRSEPEPRREWKEHKLSSSLPSHWGFAWRKETSRAGLKQEGE